MASVRVFPFCVLFCFLAFLGNPGNAQAQSTAGAQAPADKNVAELTSRDEPASFKVKVNLVLVATRRSSAPGPSAVAIRRHAEQPSNQSFRSS